MARPSCLGLTWWQGNFAGRQDTWLRWCDRDGVLLLTGDEKADQEQGQRAEIAHLLTMGMALDQVAEILGVARHDVEQMTN